MEIWNLYRLPIDFDKEAKKETMRRYGRLLRIEKCKQKLYADGKSILDCLQRKLDLSPADNEAPIQVVFSNDTPLERIRKHAVYELNIQGHYNWLKKHISPWPDNTPVCFIGIDFEADKTDDIYFCGIDFERRTIKIAIASKYDIAPISNGIQRIKSSAPIPPEKREMQFLNFWLDKDNDTIFDALAKGVKPMEYPITNWFNNKITQYSSQVNTVKQGVSEAPVLLLQGPPGTGKTTVIVEIILQAISQNKRVLLTSQTHQAVCNVLEKLHELNTNGKASVSMVRYAKQESVLSDIEKMYLAGYQEEEVKSILDRSQHTLAELKKKKDSLIDDRSICKKADELTISIKRIETQQKQDIQLTNDTWQKREQVIRQLYAGQKENENNNYNNKRNSLVYNLTKQKEELTHLEKKKQTIDKKITTFSGRLANRHSGSWSDNLFKITDHLKIFGTQSVENIKNELALQQQHLETSKQSINDCNRNIYATEQQIKSCENIHVSTISQLEEQEETEIRNNTQLRDSRILFIESNATKQITPLSENLTNAIGALQNIKDINAATPHSNDWHAYMMSLDREITQKCQEIDIKTEWLRDISASPQAIGHFLSSQVQVFMATCVGLGGWQALQNGTYEHFTNDTASLAKTKFDLVIVDEAGHATFAETVIPMCFAKKILLIGDDKQLPPILGEDLPCHANMSQSCFSGVNGLKCDCWFEYSLFSYLWGNKTFDLPQLMLDTQFRMHPDIGTFISNAFYDGKLKNGINARDRQFSFAPFVKPVCVVSTSNRKNRFDEISGTSYYNELEISLVVKTVQALVNTLEASPSSGTQPVSLAVITPYAKQVDKLRKELISFYDCTPMLDFTVEDIASVDKFQGSEKDIIVTSFVRSPKLCPSCGGKINNHHCKICQGRGHKGGKLTFVQDLKRMNVAFSRAKRQLILIGDIDALCRFDGNAEGRDVLKQFYTYVQEKGRVLHIWESEDK